MKRINVYNYEGKVIGRLNKWTVSRSRFNQLRSKNEGTSDEMSADEPIYANWADYIAIDSVRVVNDLKRIRESVKK